MRRAILAASVAVLFGCGGDSPTGPTGRVLPEGTYSVRLRGCFSCPDFTTIGNLLMFKGSDGVRLDVQISGATSDEATLSILAARLGPSELDVLDVWEDAPVALEWMEQVVGGPGFLGRTGYSCGSFGCTALATLVFRRASGVVECEFAMFHPDSGFAGTCEVL